MSSVKPVPEKDFVSYNREHEEVLSSTKPAPTVEEIEMDRELNETRARPPTPTYSDNPINVSDTHSLAIQDDINETLPDGVKRHEIQDPTQPIKHLDDSSDEGISNVSKIVHQTEDVEVEDAVVSSLARP